LIPVSALRRPSRRAILALLTAAGAASAGGAYFWTIIGPEVLIGKILSRRLPGVRTDASSIAALTRDVEAVFFKTPVRKLTLEGGALAATIIGVGPLAKFPLTAAEFYRLERIVLTFFILGSDFLTVKDPKSDLVTYNAVPDACPNPWAQYDG
jgi:hypothetical protein